MAQNLAESCSAGPNAPESRLNVLIVGPLPSLYDAHLLLTKVVNEMEQRHIASMANRATIITLFDVLGKAHNIFF